MLNYGMTANWDIGIEIPYVYSNPANDVVENGLGDVVLKSKYRIMEETASRPAFLLKPTLKLPSGNEDKGLGSGKPDTGLLAVFTKGFGGLTGHFNAGYYAADLTKDDVWKGTSGILASGALIPLDKRFTLATELIYEPTFNSDASDNSFDNLTGIIWTVNERTTYDFGVRFDIEDAAEYQLIVGVSIGF
ncbi:MAG: transporter [Planctomycetes bacterium]|nr:transporter [Planctomycetota bacterium]